MLPQFNATTCRADFDLKYLTQRARSCIVDPYLVYATGANRMWIYASRNEHVNILILYSYVNVFMWYYLSDTYYGMLAVALIPRPFFSVLNTSHGAN